MSDNSKSSTRRCFLGAAATLAALPDTADAETRTETSPHTGEDEVYMHGFDLTARNATGSVHLGELAEGDITDFQIDAYEDAVGFELNIGAVNLSLCLSAKDAHDLAATLDAAGREVQQWGEN